MATPLVPGIPKYSCEDMAYLRAWRKRCAEVLAIADSSANEEENPDISGSIHGETDQTHPSEHHSSAESVLPPENVSDLETDINSDIDIHQDLDSSESVSDVESVQGNHGNCTIPMDQLAKWATESKLTRSCVNNLLEILRQTHPDLPKDARTLLQTPRSVDTMDKCGGKYSYFGLESCMSSMLSRNKEFAQNHDDIELMVNIDGVPLHKSTNEQFWPILISFGNFAPGIVALYCGHSKPAPVEDFVSDFLEEYSYLNANALEYEGKAIHVSLKCFICDAPARAFLKCVKTQATILVKGVVSKVPMMAG